MPFGSKVVSGALIALAGFAAGCGAPPEPADLVLLGGRIVTLDDATPESTALAARGDRIIALGADDEIRDYVGPDTEIIDLAGRLAIPGFIEGHGHFTGLGRSLTVLDLRAARDWNAIVEQVAAAAESADEGDWILGFGWHQEEWDRPPDPAVQGNPVHHSLSTRTPDNPVWLKHAAGNHGAIVNSRAMAAAGISAETPDPPGGTILRDAFGKPTGMLRETAAEMVAAAHARAIAELSDEKLEAIALHEIELAEQACLENGVTSFQDAGSSFETIDRLHALAESGALDVRLWVMIRESNEALAERAAGMRHGRTVGDLFTVGGIKVTIDGALGSHGAWLLEPYADLKETAGLNTVSVESLSETARIAIEHGYQLCVHAIGDRGNRETLDVYEQTFRTLDDPSDLRWRIEHAQHLHPDDIPRFADLGVIASMQSVHCTSDGAWVPKRLGEERSRQGAYVWRELIDSGAVVINGTDTPIEEIDPIANFHAAVTRQMPNGERFYPGQAMTREEALRSYTILPAIATFEEQVKGSLSPGKLADVVVLSEDILRVPDERILDAAIDYTIVGGEIRYRR